METDALNQLRDIHLPPPIHPWWPLAPGYLLLLLLTLAGLIGYVIWTFYRKDKIKRQALQILEKVEKHYAAHKNLTLAASELHTLLKRLALAYYPRERVADLHGKAFVHFLNQTSQKIDFGPFTAFFTQYPYTEDVKPLPLTEIKQFTSHIRTWIVQQTVRKKR